PVHRERPVLEDVHRDADRPRVGLLFTQERVAEADRDAETAGLRLLVERSSVVVLVRAGGHQGAAHRFGLDVLRGRCAARTVRRSRAELTRIVEVLRAPVARRTAAAEKLRAPAEQLAEVRRPERTVEAAADS